MTDLTPEQIQNLQKMIMDQFNQMFLGRPNTEENRLLLIEQIRGMVEINTGLDLPFEIDSSDETVIPYVNVAELSAEQIKKVKKLGFHVRWED